MNIPQVQISTTQAVLGLKTINASVEMEQPRAILKQQQPAAILEMSTTLPQFHQDSTAVREDMGQNGVIKNTEVLAQRGKQGAMDGIARRARQGRELMDITSGRNVIKQHAIENGSDPIKSLGIKFIPNPLKLDIWFQPGTLDINITPQEPINEVTIQKPRYHYSAGKVYGEMLQWPSINIDVKW